jgi:hypothetical protein
MTRWFVLPRFGSCKPTPRWGGHKDRVSFNPFPLSNGHLDRVSFSSQSNATLSPHKDHHIIGVSCLGYNWVGNKNEGRIKAIQAQELKRTQMSLSIVTNLFGVIPDLGEDLIYLIVSWNEVYSSCMRFDGWKIGYIEVWWLGVFIAPTTKLTVGEGFCRMAHRTVRCATGHCPVRQPRHQAVGFWPLELLTTGPSDSPVCLLALLWLLRAQARTFHFYYSVADDRWRCVAVTPLAHRTVRWIIAERLPEFPKVASLELGSLVHRTLSGGAPDNPVRQTRAAFGLYFALVVWTLSWSFYWFVVNLWHL